MVNLAIARYGELARSVYGPSLALLRDRAHLVGIVEIDPRRRSLAVEDFSDLPIVDSIDQLRSECDVEGVLISTPPTTHAGLAVEAFEHGLASYVEKPLATNREDGNRILEAWRRSGVVGMMGFNYRFSSIIQDLKRALVVVETSVLRSRFTRAHSSPTPSRLSRSPPCGTRADLVLAAPSTDRMRDPDIRCGGGSTPGSRQLHGAPPVPGISKGEAPGSRRGADPVCLSIALPSLACR